MKTFSGDNSLPPELAEVPHTLWDTHKYDVGLIKSAQPVSIRAKLYYRPNQPEYPLKPEAIQGIKPMFDSLLATGVTVPCPVKKIHDKPPDEWRFVQDLRAVNAAVHQELHSSQIHTLYWHKFLQMHSGFQL